jgi:hypothetical protein
MLTGTQSYRIYFFQYFLLIFGTSFPPPVHKKPGSSYNTLDITLTLSMGRAIAQVVSRWLPTAAVRVRVRVWWTKWCWGRFSPSTSFSPANLHSTDCSTVTTIYHLGLYNRPVVAAVPSGLSLIPLRRKKKLVSEKVGFISRGLFD